MMADIMVDMPDIAADILVDIIWELPCPQVRSSRILSSWVGRCFGRYYLRELPWEVAKARLSAGSKRGSQQQQRQHASKPGSTPGSKLDSMPGSELDSKPGSELDCKRSSTLRCVVLDLCQAKSANIFW